MIQASVVQLARWAFRVLLALLALPVLAVKRVTRVIPDQWACRVLAARRVTPGIVGCRVRPDQLVCREQLAQSVLRETRAILALTDRPDSEVSRAFLAQ